MAKQILFNQSGGGGGGLDNGTVLWENPNPTARFGAQTITLNQNYADFEIIGVKYRVGVGALLPEGETYYKTNGSDQTATATITGSLGTKSANRYGCRNYELRNDNQVYFYAYYTAGATTTGDSGAIPLQIIGY